LCLTLNQNSVFLKKFLKRYMIKITDLHITFNKGTPLANSVLKGVNVHIQSGEFVTLIGGNGAGKSTLMNVLAGSVRPNKGKILLDNFNVTKQSIEKRSKLISRVFQDPMVGTCANLTVEENLALAAKRGLKRGLGLALGTANRISFREHLAHLSIGLENRLKDPVGSLSGGQRQAVSLLMATLRPCKIILLDEHTAALDPKMAKIIIQLTQQLVKEHGLTALMITHSMTQALELGNRTLLMHQGTIARDLTSKERLALKPADLLALFDIVN
jgi:putative ABC transport system ATP-binding protein